MHIPEFKSWFVEQETFTLLDVIREVLEIKNLTESIQALEDEISKATGVEANWVNILGGKAMKKGRFSSRDLRGEHAAFTALTDILMNLQPGKNLKNTVDEINTRLANNPEQRTKEITALLSTVAGRRGMDVRKKITTKDDEGAPVGVASIDSEEGMGAMHTAVSGRRGGSVTSADVSEFEELVVNALRQMQQGATRPSQERLEQAIKLVPDRLKGMTDAELAAHHNLSDSRVEQIMQDIFAAMEKAAQELGEPWVSQVRTQLAQRRRPRAVVEPVAASSSVGSSTATAHPAPSPLGQSSSQSGL